MYLIKSVVAWVEDRTRLESTVRHFFAEEIPGSSGWHQVFGSVATFCLMLQIFTGILLALNYAPTTGEAHSSLRYIITEVTAGSLVRALHHFGASGMIIIVVLHMLQVFLWGAYKRPREATWMIGVVLLLFTLGFGLTGYLLPWDNRAYWGTVVTTQIAGLTPGMGAFLLRLLGSENGQIGAVTFSRFYTAHVMILPLLTLGLVALHVYLVRLHGVAPDAVETKPTEKFYPRQVFKDTVAIFVTFAILFLMAVFIKVPLGKMADPTDISYIPRPEWYFLFLFEMLKYFEGAMEVVGSIILPGVFVGLLFLAPFIDRSKAIELRKRTLSFGLVVLMGIGWVMLTAAALRGTPEPKPWLRLPPEQMAAIGTFRAANCSSCHSLEFGKSSQGPNLAQYAVLRDKDWLGAHFKEVTSTGVKGISTLQFKQLATFMSVLDDENSEAIAKAPQELVGGAQIYQKSGCFGCHIVNGVGMSDGPNLNGVARRRTADWFTRHFRDPQEVSPGTTMPDYPFPDAEMKLIVAYLGSMTD